MQAIKYFLHEPFPLLAELKLFNNTEEGGGKKHLLLELHFS